VRSAASCAGRAHASGGLGKKISPQNSFCSSHDTAERRVNERHAVSAMCFLRDRAPGHMPHAHQNEAAATIGAAPPPPKHGGPLEHRSRRSRVDKSAPRDREGGWQYGARRPWATGHTRTQNDPATALRAAPAPPKHGGRLERRRGTQRAKNPSISDPARRDGNGRQSDSPNFNGRGRDGCPAADLQCVHDAQ
jgi:hypothetical protein